MFQRNKQAKQKKRKPIDSKPVYSSSIREVADHNDSSTSKKPHYLWLYAFFVLGLSTSGYLLSPYGRVNQLYVEGETIVPEQLIMEASQITSKQTVIGTLSNRVAIEAQIQAALPQIRMADVGIQGINDIVVHVADYQTVAYIDNGNRYQSVLENGVILLDDLTVPLGNRPLIKGFESGSTLNKFITEFSKASSDIQDSISEITYKGSEENPYSITIHMNDGNQVKANLNEFISKMNYYPVILEELGSQKGIIDMEVGVFFTPFVSEERAQEDSHETVNNEDLNEE